MNLASYFLDHNLPERAHKVAVRYTPPGGLEQSYTFHQMHVWSNRVGNRLRSMQLREEDRVLFALDDTPEFAAHWFGALRVGGVVAILAARRMMSGRSCRRLTSTAHFTSGSAMRTSGP